MDVVGSIIELCLQKQEDYRVAKLFKKVGKPYTARAAIESCVVATQTVGKTYYDHHKEANWYDYEEESVEPKPISERMIGLKIK
mmetsp:Transcript_5071/g.6212  ORF Transcript_5071/g.6212 Transcript_5071/m.6212 type:complete len:84 (+) Transcript_5071:57-308(+)